MYTDVCKYYWTQAQLRNDALDDRSRKSLTAMSKMAIGVNGHPLKVMDQVNQEVSLGRF